MNWIRAPPKTPPITNLVKGGENGENHHKKSDNNSHTVRNQQ